MKKQRHDESIEDTTITNTVWNIWINTEQHNKYTWLINGISKAKRQQTRKRHYESIDWFVLVIFLLRITNSSRSPAPRWSDIREQPAGSSSKRRAAALRSCSSCTSDGFGWTDRAMTFLDRANKPMDFGWIWYWLSFHFSGSWEISAMAGTVSCGACLLPCQKQRSWATYMFDSYLVSVVVSAAKQPGWHLVAQR